MKREEIKVCIIRVGGTNCDAETKRAFDDLGVKSEILHLNEVIRRKILLDYNLLVFPGGFSYGDYVRAGAILAKSIVAKLGKRLRQFLKEERPVLGVCNGFQVLVEAGILPGFEGASEHPQAALATNTPIGYRCMWVHLKHNNRGKCVFTQRLKKEQAISMPIAHAEGRFMFEKEKEQAHLQKLYENDQLVFRYCTGNDKYPEGKYPANPNGAFHDIAGICDPTGTIFGLMPHPERAYYGWQLPDWTRMERAPEHGDGKLIFESVIEYITKHF